MDKKVKGFTLIELLVVIAIIAILAAIIAPNAFKAIEKSKVSRVVSDCKAIEAATLQYYGDTGEWPRILYTGATNMECYLKKPSDITGYTVTGVNGWDGPYLEKWGKNPFNSGAMESEYNYQYDYRTINLKSDLVIEISLNGVNNWESIATMLDKSIDNGDGKSSGKIQYTNAYVSWTIVENAENVKNAGGTTIGSH